MSKYKCTGSKRIGIVITEKKNYKDYRQNFQLTKNGFHKFVSLKHGVDNKNNHFLKFSIIDNLESSYYNSKSPSFEEEIIVYLEYLEWYNYYGEKNGKFYHDLEG